MLGTKGFQQEDGRCILPKERLVVELQNDAKTEKTNTQRLELYFILSLSPRVSRILYLGKKEEEEEEKSRCYGALPVRALWCVVQGRRSASCAREVEWAACEERRTSSCGQRSSGSGMVRGASSAARVVRAMRKRRKRMGHDDGEGVSSSRFSERAGREFFGFFFWFFFVSFRPFYFASSSFSFLMR